MILESAFEAILLQSESETLDFKATGYDLQSDHGRFSLVKDIISMANTPRDSESFIVCGVKLLSTGEKELVGCTAHPDEADLQSQFAERVYPLPTFSYETVTYREKEYGVYRIPPIRIGPCVPVRDYGDSLRRVQVYFRRRSKNDVATPHDLTSILDWFRKSIPSRLHYEDASWDAFYRSAYAFDASRFYCLVCSRLSMEVTTDLSPLGLLPWSAAFDFDPDSDREGLLFRISPLLSQYRSLHLVTLKDRPKYNFRTGTYWYFPRGLAGRDPADTGKWKDWQKQSVAFLNEHLVRLARETSPSLGTVIVIWEDMELSKHLRTQLEALMAAFGERINIVIVSKDVGGFRDLADDTEATLVEMPLHHLCSGLKVSLSGLGSTDVGVAAIPTSSNTPLILPAKELRWLEEELELATLDVGQNPPENRIVGRDFLRGDEISWYELGIHSDVERDLMYKLEKQVRTDLDSRRTSRINLYHSPGAGGTTLARRLLWNFHREYPCVLLKSTEPQETAERINFLSSLSGQAVLMVADGATVTERTADELYDQLKARHVPIVIVQVLRRFAPSTDGQRSFFLQDALSSSESQRFKTIYGKEQPNAARDLDQLAANTDSRFRTAFYFALVAFKDDFKGIEPYVGARLSILSDIQKQMLAFLSFAHHYGQQLLPAQAFSDLLGLPKSKSVEMEAALPSGALELLVQIERGKWRPAHDLVSLEILRQVLWPAPDRRLWKQNLSRWAAEFAEFCRGSDAIPGEEMVEVVRRCFVYRDNSDVLGTERAGQNQFARLIEDIESKDGALELLRNLTELFPDEPHLWAHLGRFYSVEKRDFKAAVDCIDHALAFRDRDHVLHHMRGMALRQQVYDGIESDQPLGQLVSMAKAASESFAQARLLMPDDEHGYISEVQLIIRLLDFASRKSANLLAYLSAPGIDPYIRESFERCEDLLERVRRNREGEGASAYEETCRGQLDRLYGKHDKALQTWDSLLSRKDIYAPPIRRQLVWTYLARHNRSWYDLKDKEIERIIELLEKNLREEPHIDTNLRLWVQAVRQMDSPPSFESVLERIGYWRTNANSLEAVFYSYVVYALQAIGGSVIAIDSANRYIEECRNRTRFHRHRTKSLEWLGSGSGIAQLVHHSQLGEWSKAQDFWENTSQLVRLPGRITRIDAPQSGEIETQGGLKAFFVPARGNFNRGRSENQSITCFLGFSYEGLRAWEVKES